MTLQVGDKVITIPLRGGGRVTVRSGTVAVGDKVVMVPGVGGQLYAVRLASPLVGDKVILYPLRGGGYATLQTTGAPAPSYGPVVAWGYNGYGQCTVPADLVATQVAAGGQHSLALRPDGSVVAWGYNGYGQCTVPADLVATQIAGGGHHSLALTESSG